MFVPCRHVERYWREVVRPMISFQELGPVVDYMQRTWIGTSPTDTSRGIKPFFPPELWNQYRAVISQRPRHNDHMESNNAKLQKLIKSNPSVWEFLIGLRSAYKGDFALIYQVWLALPLCSWRWIAGVTLGMDQWKHHTSANIRCC